MDAEGITHIPIPLLEGLDIDRDFDNSTQIVILFGIIFVDVVVMTGYVPYGICNDFCGSIVTGGYRSFRTVGNLAKHIQP